MYVVPLVPVDDPVLALITQVVLEAEEKWPAIVEEEVEESLGSLQVKAPLVLLLQGEGEGESAWRVGNEVGWDGEVEVCEMGRTMTLYSYIQKAK